MNLLQYAALKNRFITVKEWQVRFISGTSLEMHPRPQPLSTSLPHHHILTLLHTEMSIIQHLQQWHGLPKVLVMKSNTEEHLLLWSSPLMLLFLGILALHSQPLLVVTLYKDTVFAKGVKLPFLVSGYLPPPQSLVDFWFTDVVAMEV